MGTLDSIADNAFENVENSNPTEPVAEQVVSEPAKVQEVAEQPKEQEDQVFTKLNPNELPEEVKPYYKSLLKDYTQKRQAESARVKELEKQMEQYKSQLSKGTFEPSEQTPQESPEEYYRRIAKETFIQEQESMWDTQAMNEYPKLDSRLDESNPIEFDEMLDTALRSYLTDKLEEHVNSNGTKLQFDYKSTAKEFINKWDSYVENLIKSHTAKQNKLIKEKEIQTKKVSPSTTSTPTVKTGKVSLEDAISTAFDAK